MRWDFSADTMVGVGRLVSSESMGAIAERCTISVLTSNQGMGAGVFGVSLVRQSSGTLQLCHSHKLSSYHSSPLHRELRKKSITPLQYPTSCPSLSSSLLIA